MKGYLFSLVTVLSFSFGLAQGNLNWETLDAGTTSNINEIYFQSPDTGYIVGDNYLFKKTTDGGITWVDLAPPSAGERPGNNGKIVGIEYYTNFGFGRLNTGLYLSWEQPYHGLFTGDEGNSYSEFSYGDSNQICNVNGFSVLPALDGNGYTQILVYGQGCTGNAVYTNFYDGPYSFTVYEILPSNLPASFTSVDVDSASFIYGNSDGHLLRYVNVLAVPDSIFLDSSGVRSLVYAGSHKWYAMTNRGFDNMYVSLDSGQTFALDASFPVTFFYPKINDFSFLPNDVGIAGASSNDQAGSIVVRDSSNWAIYGAEHPINAVKLFANGIAYAAGDNGLIMKTDVLPSVAVNEVGNPLNVLKIFPNPVTEVAHLNGLENQVIDSIQLLDVHGKLIHSFPRDKRELDLSDIPSGMYLLTVHGEGQEITRKLVVQ